MKYGLLCLLLFFQGHIFTAITPPALLTFDALYSDEPLSKNQRKKLRKKIKTMDAQAKGIALIAAVRCGEVDFTRGLLDADADPNFVDDTSFNPMLTAIHSRSSFSPECLHLVLLKGAAVDYVISYSKMTFLHIAAKYGYPKKIRILRRFGAEVDAHASFDAWDGWTPLQMACASCYSNVATVEELLLQGADGQALDRKGRNALDLAMLHDWNPKIIAVLRSKGIKPAISKEDFHEARRHFSSITE